MTIIMECLVVSLAIGHKQYLNNIKEMYKLDPLTKWAYWCWVGITPTIVIVCTLSINNYILYFSQFFDSIRVAYATY